jgi:hypothetical protein
MQLLKSKLAFIRCFFGVCILFVSFFVANTIAKAENYVISGSQEAEPGESLDLTVKLTGEDIIGVGGIYTCDAGIDSVQFYNATVWSTFQIDTDKNQVGVVDYNGHLYDQWNYIINGTEAVFNIRITISEEAKYGDVLNFGFEKLYYAKTTDAPSSASVDDIKENIKYNLAEGNAFSITVTNKNPIYYNDGSLDVPVVTNVSTRSTSGNTVFWKTTTDADGYRIMRRLNKAGSKWALIYTTDNIKLSSYVDTTAVLGTSYIYTIRAYKKDENGDYALSGYTSGMYSLKLPVIYSISSTAQNRNIVKWNAVSGATSYAIYRKTAGGSWKYIGKSTTVSYTDMDSNSSELYYYTVRAVRVNSGITAYSWYNSGKYSLKNPVFTITATSKNINTIKWSRVTGATSYIIYRKTAGNNFKKLATTTSLSYVDKTARSGTKYYYTVRAVRNYTLNTKSYNDYSFYTTKYIKTK